MEDGGARCVGSVAAVAPCVSSGEGTSPTPWPEPSLRNDYFNAHPSPTCNQVVSTDAMDGFADWPTVHEDFRFDSPTPSDVTWHRWAQLGEGRPRVGPDPRVAVCR